MFDRVKNSFPAQYMAFKVKNMKNPLKNVKNPFKKEEKEKEMDDTQDTTDNFDYAVAPKQDQEEDKPTPGMIDNLKAEVNSAMVGMAADEISGQTKKFIVDKILKRVSDDNRIKKVLVGPLGDSIVCATMGRAMDQVPLNDEKFKRVANTLRIMGMSRGIMAVKKMIFKRK